MKHYVYVKSASVSYHRYNKEYYLKIVMSGEGLTVTILENIKTRLSHIVLKMADFDLDDLDQSMEDFPLYLDEPIKLEGAVFKAKVPPMYKYDDCLWIDTVEGFYSPHGKYGARLDHCVYERIRKVMRYRLFATDINGEKIFAIPGSKNRQRELLEFWNKTYFDCDNYGEVHLKKGMTRDDVNEMYMENLESVLDRFDVKYSPFE